MDVDQNTLLVHTTDRQSFKNCRMRWYFSSPLRLSYRPRRVNPNLRFGSAWHAALAVYYTTSRNIDAAKFEFNGYLLDWFQGLTNPTEEDEYSYVDSLKLGNGMLDHYGKYAHPLDGFETVWVERTIEVPLFDNIMYSATPDGLVRDGVGRLWIIEHKTADKLPTDNDDYLLMDEQVGSYIWALHESTGEWAEGVIYNIARKKLPTPLKVLKNGSLSIRKDADTTYDYALADIKMNYDGAVPPEYTEFLDMLKAKGNRFFYRQMVRRNRREIEILAKHIEMEAREMLNPDLPIYRNPSKFNCGSCAYVGPCIAYYEGSDWKIMLEGNYDVATGRTK